jgi:hypothetical protein
MKPEELSRELRGSRAGFMAQRRGIAALSMAAIGSMGLISLYQLGLIKHLPEPPLPFFDADKVDAAPEAYALFNTPDGVIGLGSYALTLGLAAIGRPDRAERQPWLSLALAAKVGFDTSGPNKRLFASGACWLPPRPFSLFRWWCLKPKPPWASC